MNLEIIAEASKIPYTDDANICKHSPGNVEGSPVKLYFLVRVPKEGGSWIHSVFERHNESVLLGVKMLRNLERVGVSKAKVVNIVFSQNLVIEVACVQQSLDFGFVSRGGRLESQQIKVVLAVWLRISDIFWVGVDNRDLPLIIQLQSEHVTVVHGRTEAEADPVGLGELNLHIETLVLENTPFKN